MHRRLWAGVVGLALCSCGSDPGYTVIDRPSVIASEPRASDPASPEAPRKVVIALQTCVDHFAYRFSPNSYAVLYDIEATELGITAVKVKDSMLANSDLEACLTRALERMDIPATALDRQQGATPQSRSAVGIVQAAAAPIAMAPIVLVAGGVLILVGVTIYVATGDVTADDVLNAARRRPVITKSRCLDAAAGGTFMWQQLCRAITNAKKAERCWSLVGESEEEKRNWCNEGFGTW